VAVLEEEEIAFLSRAYRQHKVHVEYHIIGYRNGAFVVKNGIYVATNKPASNMARERVKAGRPGRTRNAERGATM
jgi:hypothetical protein